MEIRPPIVDPPGAVTVDQLTLLFALLLGAVVSVPVGERLGLPAPVLMTVLGAVLALLEFVPNVDIPPDLISRYIADHPDSNIVFRRNAVNKGWAQNYVDSTFIGRGRYHRAICGDNSEMESTIRNVLRPRGEAPLIITK